MSQVNRSTVAQPIPLKQQRYGLAAGIAAGVASAAVVGVFIFSPVTPAPAVLTPQLEELEQLVDGYLPGLLAAEAARVARMQDGYLPGLLAAQAARVARVQDGYLPGLLAAAESVPIGGDKGSDTRDGWESGLLP